MNLFLYFCISVLNIMTYNRVHEYIPQLSKVKGFICMVYIYRMELLSIGVLIVALVQAQTGWSEARSCLIGV